MHKAKILLGGGLKSAPQERWEGGLWILEVEGREEAVRLCEDDPFFANGLRKGYRLQGVPNLTAIELPPLTGPTGSA
jgi:uncharacterized protein YciI